MSSRESASSEIACNHTFFFFFVGAGILFSTDEAETIAEAADGRDIQIKLMAELSIRHLSPVRDNKFSRLLESDGSVVHI